MNISRLNEPNQCVNGTVSFRFAAQNSPLRWRLGIQGESNGSLDIRSTFRSHPGGHRVEEREEFRHLVVLWCNAVHRRSSDGTDDEAKRRGS